MNDLEKLMEGLDKQAPNWALDNADTQDLRDYIENVQRRAPGVAMSVLRKRVANRLSIVVRAAVGAGLVRFEDRI